LQDRDNNKIPFRETRPGRIAVRPASSGRGGCSFTAEKADSSGERAAVVNAVGKEVRGVVVIVDEDPVFPAGHVVEASANGPVVAQSVKSLFNVGI